MQDILIFIQHHGSLFTAFIAVFALLLIIEFIRIKQGGNQITPAIATGLINHQNAVVVDIRKSEEFTQGHIVDAISLPTSGLEIQPKKLEKFKSRPIVLTSSTGQEAGPIAALLAKQGFNVFILSGGIRAWLNAEMPLVKG